MVSDVHYYQADTVTYYKKRRRNDMKQKNVEQIAMVISDEYNTNSVVSMYLAKSSADAIDKSIKKIGIELMEKLVTNREEEEE